MPKKMFIAYKIEKALSFRDVFLQESYLHMSVERHRWAASTPVIKMH